MPSFQNKGLMDLKAAKTFGVNVKQDGDTAIGQFGTGFKYAVAAVLRNGGRISVWRGIREHKFSCKKRIVRGKAFKFIYLDGKELGFTTTLGAHWEPWMAFREIYSNMLDENGFAAKSLQPLPKHTTIVVQGWKEFNEAFANTEKYFLTSKPFIERHQIELHNTEGPNGTIFYRGIRVGKFEHPSIFCYNFLHGFSLTEDRTLKSIYEMKYYAKDFFFNLQGEDRKWIIRKMLYAKSGTFERSLDFSDLITADVRNTFMEVVEEIVKNKELDKVNPSIRKALREFRPTTEVLEMVQLSGEPEAILVDVLETINKLNIGNITSILSVLCAKSLSVPVLLHKGQMFITEEAILEGRESLIFEILDVYIPYWLGYTKSEDDRITFLTKHFLKGVM